MDLRAAQLQAKIHMWLQAAGWPPQQNRTTRGPLRACSDWTPKVHFPQ